MHKVTASSFLLILQRIGERSLGLVSTLILARLLTPEDFGIIAVAMLVLWFIENFSNAGTELYIIQKEDVTAQELNSAWTLDLLLKIGAFSLILIASLVLGLLIEKVDEALALFFIGITLPCKGLKNPGLWLLKRQQNYSSIVKTSVAIKAVSLCFTIPYALMFKDFWAIVLGLVISSFLEMVVSYRLSDHRPVFNCDYFREQWNFSKWLIPHEVLGYFRHHLDTITVTARFSSPELGGYNNLKYFASLPILQFLSPLVDPLHAELGRVQNNSFELKFQSDITILVMSFLATPIAVVFFTSSEELVSLFLGEQWTEYHTVFSYFGLLVLPFILLSQSNRLLMILGRTRIIFFFELFATICTGVALIFVPIDSIADFALIRVLIEFSVCSVFYFYVYRYAFGVLGIFNYALVITPSVVCVISIVWSQSIFTYTSKIMILFSNSFLTGLLVALIFFFWYKILGTKREKNVILKYSPFRFK